MPDKMWMKKNYNPKNFAGMLLRIRVWKIKKSFLENINLKSCFSIKDNKFGSCQENKRIEK